MPVKVFAAAKLNLSLDITGIRHDGYHLIEMVMQSVDLFDILTLWKQPGLSVVCDMPGLSGKNNLAYKAAELFFKTVKLPLAVGIDIQKYIPIAGGLAGGSADAAAVLCGLNRLYETGLPESALCEIGLKLGADVPFCIRGGTKFVTGIGENIADLPPFPECFFVLIKKGEKPSTAEMYRRFDSLSDVSHPKTDSLINAIENNKLIQAAGFCENVFEPLWGKDIQSVKTHLKSFGAAGAALSGSGPSVFGIFSNEKAAAACAAEIQTTDNQVIICKPVHSGCFIKEA